MTRRISRFWLDRAAGVPLGNVWHERDARQSWEALETVELDAWLKLSTRRRQALLPRHTQRSSTAACPERLRNVPR